MKYALGVMAGLSGVAALIYLATLCNATFPLKSEVVVTERQMRLTLVLATASAVVLGVAAWQW